MQGLPSLKTVHRTVFKFTPLGAPYGRGVSPSADGDKGRRPLTLRASGARLDRALYFASRLGHTALFSPPSNHGAFLHSIN